MSNFLRTVVELVSTDNRERIFYISLFFRVTVSEKTVLFESSLGNSFGGHPRALYEDLLEAGFDGEILWSAERGVRVPGELRAHPNTRIVRRGTRAYANGLLRASTLVNDTTFPLFFTRRKLQSYLNTWHGIPLKTLGTSTNEAFGQWANTQRNFLQASHVLTFGEYFEKSVFEDYGAPLSLLLNVIDGPAPRLQHTKTRGVKAGGALRQRLGAGPAQRIVLFAPTWRGTISNRLNFSSAHTQALIDLSEKLGPHYKIVFSAHNLAEGKINGVPGVYVKSSTDNLYDILAVVDFVVTDYSSVLFDAIVLEIPVVLWQGDAETYERERGFAMDPSVIPVPSFKKMSDVAAAIKNNSSAESRGSLRRFVSDLLPFEGNSTYVSPLRIREGKISLPSQAANHTRPNILIHGGNLSANGITSSLKNLVAALDPSLMNVHIIIDRAGLAETPGASKRQKEFPGHVNWIVRSGATAVQQNDREIYGAFLQGSSTLSDDETSRIREIFRLEAQRVLGGATFDVAIEFSGYSPWWANFILHVPAGRKVIYQHNDMFLESQNPCKHFPGLDRVFSLYKNYDQIVSVSEAVRRKNAENLAGFYRHQKSAAVRNVIDPSAVISQAEISPIIVNRSFGALFYPHEGKRFFWMGRLSPEKRVDIAIRAFSRVCVADSRALLFIAGDGPLKSELQRLVAELNIEAQVVFLGHVAKPHALLARSDCLLLTSAYEGQGMVLLEAGVLGVPSIAFDVPGVSEAVDPRNSTLVKPGDFEGLTTAMLKVLYDEEPKKQNKVWAEAKANVAIAEFYKHVLAIAP